MDGTRIQYAYVFFLRGTNRSVANSLLRRRRHGVASRFASGFRGSSGRHGWLPPEGRATNTLRVPGRKSLPLSLVVACREEPVHRGSLRSLVALAVSPVGLNR